jgi:signal transduction histidine kinase
MQAPQPEPTPPTAPRPPQAEETSRLILSDLAEAVAHEFNNLLNNVLLQLEVLKRQGAVEDLASKATAMQQRCRQAAGLLTKLQRFGEARQPPFSPVDLNQVVREVAGGNVLGAHKDWPLPIRLELDGQLQPLLANAADLARLVAFLLEHAAAVTPAPAAVTLRTEQGPDGCQLVVEDLGPVVAADAHRKLLEPFTMARPGADDWALSVCKVLARRLHGTLRVSNRGEEGMTFAVEFPTEREKTVRRTTRAGP